MLISLIVPCYNEERALPYLYQALCDLRNELSGTGKSFEFIFVNDGSTDGTKDVIKGFAKDEHVKVIIRPEDITLKDTLEAGDNVFAEGEVISCVFKGIHYEMYVKTSAGFELQVQDYRSKNIGDKVYASIVPFDIHVIKG